MASRMSDNPWSEDSLLSGISLGKPQNALATLRSCGLRIVSIYGLACMLMHVYIASSSILNQLCFHYCLPLLFK